MAVNVEELYRKYGPMVLRRCRFLLRDEDAALDAMQEVFVRVLRRENTLNQKAPSSLLYTIATNLCLNWIRDGSKRAFPVEDEILGQIASFDSSEERLMDKFLIEEIFQDEQDKTRTIAVLHYVDRMTLEETAEIVGMSVSGIRKRLRKLREKGLSVKEEAEV